jgi:hypothetical protein
MTASVYHDSGALEFHLWEGQLLLPVAIGDYYARLGRSGEGSQELSRLAPDSDIVANYLTTSLSVARQAQAIVAGWQAKYLRITDPTNKVWTSVLAKVVAASVRRGKYGYGTTIYGYRCEARLTLSVQP